MHTINMKRIFTIEMNDNTTVEAGISIVLSTEDEFNAERQINRIVMGDIFIPLIQLIETIICSTQDDDDGDVDDDGSVGRSGEDILTAADYPECAE